MITIIFESHSTTIDNEKHLSSGHNDVDLSPLGVEQAKELGERYLNEHFDVIFCSDLQRAYKTGEIAFGDKFPIIKDARLRECDYGDLTQHGLDYWINGVSLEVLVTTSFKWQPGWKYEL